MFSILNNEHDVTLYHAQLSQRSFSIWFKTVLDKKKN